MSYLRKGLWGIIALFALAVVGNATGYLTRLVLTRTLSIEEYGLLYSVISLVLFLMIFSNFGFGGAAIKYIALYKAKKDYPRMKWVVVYTTVLRLAIASVLGAGIWVGSSWLSSHYYKTSEVVPLLYLFAGGIVVMTASQILGRVFNGLHLTWYYGLIDTLQKIIFFAGVLVCSWAGIGLTSSTAGSVFVVASIITVALFIRPFLTETRLLSTKTNKDKQLTSRINRFAYASFLTGLGYLIIGYIDTLMLTYFRPLAEVGVYNAVLPTIMVLAFVNNTLYNILFPIASDLTAKKRKAELAEGAKTLQKYAFVGILPIVFIFITFPGLVLNTLFGKEYVVGSSALVILALGIPFLILSGIHQAILSGIGKPINVTKTLVWAAVINVAINLFAIPRWGMNGAAVGTSISYLFIFCMLSFYTSRTIRLRQSPSVWVKLFLCSVVFVGTVYLVKALININPFVEAMVCLVVAGMVYIGAAMALQIVEVKEMVFFGKTLFSSTSAEDI